MLAEKWRYGAAASDHAARLVLAFGRCRDRLTGRPSGGFFTIFRNSVKKQLPNIRLSE
jgi:hypothetical protein